jgi:hypothetical protein
MIDFKKGLEPKEAMNVGMSHICKKLWDRELCEKCEYAHFGWQPYKLGEDFTNKNNCKLGYWGMPDEL